MHVPLDSTSTDSGLAPVALVGAGRLGSALAPALRAAGVSVAGPLRREEPLPSHAPVVLLCVEDAAIADAAAGLPAGRLVGHCSGATGLDVLAPHEGFSLHPLLSVTADRETVFAGAGAAIAGVTPRALDLARRLAGALGMEAVAVSDADRIAYHAAAAIASNFLVTLEGFAEELAASCGVERRLLAPLVRSTVANWVELGAARALTGPIARGDDAIAAAHRSVVAERTPQRLALFDALAASTRALAAEAAGR